MNSSQAASGCNLCTGWPPWRKNLQARLGHNSDPGSCACQGAAASESLSPRVEPSSKKSCGTLSCDGASKSISATSHLMSVQRGSAGVRTHLRTRLPGDSRTFLEGQGASRSAVEPCSGEKPGRFPRRRKEAQGTGTPERKETRQSALPPTVPPVAVRRA